MLSFLGENLLQFRKIYYFDGQLYNFLFDDNECLPKSHGSVRSQLSLCTLHNCLCDSHKKQNNSSKIIQSAKEDAKNLP